MKFSEKGKSINYFDSFNSGTRKSVFTVIELDEVFLFISLIVFYTAYLFGWFLSRKMIWTSPVFALILVLCENIRFFVSLKVVTAVLYVLLYASSFERPFWIYSSICSPLIPSLDTLSKVHSFSEESFFFMFSQMKDLPEPGTPNGIITRTVFCYLASSF